jgi:hypothetical protein
MHIEKSVLDPVMMEACWKDESTSIGTSTIEGKYQRLEEARKDSPLQISEGACPPIP